MGSQRAFRKQWVRWLDDLRSAADHVATLSDPDLRIQSLDLLLKQARVVANHMFHHALQLTGSPSQAVHWVAGQDLNRLRQQLTARALRVLPPPSFFRHSASHLAAADRPWRLLSHGIHPLLTVTHQPYWRPSI